MIEIKTPFLERYTENLSFKVANSQNEYKVIGREKEIENVEVSLLRKTKNSPILIGEAGVGKTAIAEGLALKIVQKNVPERLKGITIWNLELSSLMSDDENGNFTPKFKAIIDELKLTKGKNLLFIDEIHTIMGTGGNDTPLDAGNIIKPALARGEIQLIGATTIVEYHQFIEKDKAMERRFDVIRVEEPSIKQAIEILTGVKEKFENFHGVKISDLAVKQAVQLSARFIPELFLPDKAIDLLDNASTRASFSKEKKVTQQQIAESIRDKKGIPITTILKGEAKRLENIEKILHARVKGQDQAIREVNDAVNIANAGLQDENRPISSFLFLGTTGTGKTELSKALAEAMFDREEEMIRFDMSEFSQKGSSHKLLGDTKEEGLLIKKIKEKQYCVLLFDEVEKANQEVHDLMLQILEDGRLTDSYGRLVNFSNAIIIFTTNLGSKMIQSNADLKGIDLTEREHSQFMQRIDNALQSDFRPEFLNRIQHKIVFNMLEKDVIKEIAEKNLEILNNKMKSQRAVLTYEPEILDYLADNGTDKFNGARPLERLIGKVITAPISKILLADHSKKRHIHLRIEGMTKSNEIIEKRKIIFEFETRN